MIYLVFGLPEYQQILHQIGFRLLDASVISHEYSEDQRRDHESHPLIFAEDGKGSWLSLALGHCWFLFVGLHQWQNYVRRQNCINGDNPPWRRQQRQFTPTLFRDALDFQVTVLCGMEKIGTTSWGLKWTAEPEAKYSRRRQWWRSKDDAPKMMLQRWAHLSLASSRRKAEIRNYSFLTLCDPWLIHNDVSHGRDRTLAVTEEATCIRTSCQRGTPLLALAWNRWRITLLQSKNPCGHCLACSWLICYLCISSWLELDNCPVRLYSYDAPYSVSRRDNAGRYYSGS